MGGIDKSWLLVAALALLLLAVLYFKPSNSNLITPEAFTQRFVERLAAKNPTAKILVTKPLLGVADDFEFNLDNAYKSYVATPRQLDAILDHFGRGLAALIASRNFKPDRSHVRAVIRDISTMKDGNTVLDPLGQTMAIVYVVDLPMSLGTITNDYLEQLKVERSELLSLSRANLEKAVPSQGQWLINGRYARLQDDENPYVTSLALMGDYWDRQKFPFKGDLVLYIPNRHTLLITGTEEPTGIQEAARAATMINLTAPYPVSVEPLVRKDRAWRQILP